MEMALIGVAIITTAVVADLVWKVRKKGKSAGAAGKPAGKNSRATELLKELRTKAYL